MPWVLREDISLRKEKNRVIIVADNLSEMEYFADLHPIAATILVLFDGSRTEEEVVKIIQEIFNTDKERADALVSKIVRQFSDLFYWNENIISSESPRYSPKQFIFPIERTPRSNVRLERPIGFAYVVHHACHRKCIYCYANADYDPSIQPPLISLKRLEELFKEASNIGVRMIQLTGGEPFLREDIVEIIGSIIDNGMLPDISTKYPLTQNIVDKLVRVGLNKIQISIDSSVPEISDTMVGCKGAFHDSIDTIKRLVSSGIKVRTNSVLTTMNIDRVGDLINMLVDLGVDKILLTPYARSFGRHEDSLFASEEQFKNLSDIVTKYNKKYDVSIRYEHPLLDQLSKSKEVAFKNRLYCTAGRMGFIMLPDGKVTICERLFYNPEFIVGDLNDQSIMDMWNSDRIKEVIYPPRLKYSGTKCYDCKDYDECLESRGRCYVRSKLVYNNSYAPDPLCPVMQSSKRLI